MAMKRQSHFIGTSHLTVADVGAHTASFGCRKRFPMHSGTVIEAWCRCGVDRQSSEFYHPLLRLQGCTSHLQMTGVNPVTYHSAN